MNVFYGSLGFIHNHILFLNNSKFFAGVIMIMLNIGSKFIAIQFSRSTEEYLKMNITKQCFENSVKNGSFSQEFINKFNDGRDTI